jgi:hypothetical protein
MVEAVDQRIVLEAALVRLASLEADTTPAALLERIERLERALASGGVSTPPSPPPAKGESPAAAGRRAITPPSSVATAESPSGDLPSRDDLTLAWGDVLLAKIPRAAKARYSSGRFVEVGANGAVFAVPNAPHMAKCEEFRADVERVLGEHFGSPFPLVLTVDDSAPPPATKPAPSPAKAVAPKVRAPKIAETEEVIDVHELVDAPPDNRTSLDQLAEAFPGAELLREDNDG